MQKDEGVRFLVFGDPEGDLRQRDVRALALKYLKKNDYIVFMGDYYSNVIDEYKIFKSGKLFPEMRYFGKLYKKFRIILAFGNKDIRSKYIGLQKKRENFNKSILLNERTLGSLSDDNMKFGFVHGSDLWMTPPGKKYEEMANDIRNAISAYKKKKKIKRRVLVTELPYYYKKKLLDKYGEEFKFINEYSFFTQFSILRGKRIKSDI
ncbi:MAG: metallophosphoesterase, partial [Candidatus Aenigmarchaeota archaeon]|nr:metallophosphoesterase [Candidatus Aenigmarchaeota archaeon]